MKKFDKAYPYIRYANCFEDADILKKVIDKSAKNVLSIASGGDNSLSLLNDNIEKLVVFDLNPAQLNLVKLKAAAFKYLTYQETLVLLGIKEGDSKKEYQKIAPNLEDGVKTFFDNYLDFMKLKPINCGKFEYYLYVINSRILPLAVSKKKINKFMSMGDGEEQARYYKKKINNLRWKFLTKIFFSQKTVSKLGREKSFFKYSSGDLRKEILKRFTRCIKNTKNSENSYLQYAVYNNFHYYPVYLREENFERIKRNIDKIIYVEGDIFEVAKLGMKFDFLNLSDIFEYMDENFSAKNEHEISGFCNIDAKVTFWNMMVERSFDSKAFTRLDSENFKQTEKTFYYMDLKIYRRN